MFYFRCNKHVMVKLLFAHFTSKNKTLITDMSDCLLCDETADTKAGRKRVATKNIMWVFSAVYRNCVDTSEIL